MTRPSAAPARRAPVLELLVLIGLPLAVIVAGAVTTAIALDHGFAPIEPASQQQARGP